MPLICLPPMDLKKAKQGTDAGVTSDTLMLGGTLLSRLLLFIILIIVFTQVQPREIIFTGGRCIEQYISCK